MAASGLQTKVAQWWPIPKQKKTMVAHVAHSVVISFKFSHQNEAMNINQNEIIITLRICLTEKLATKSYELAIIDCGLQTNVAQW